MLWRIEGFNSDDPPPSALQAPTTYDPSKQTRSAFTPVVSAARPVQYTRLLKFSTPDCNVQFFMRFRMFNVPGKHAVLAFCNTRSRIMFWDMERLTVYSDYRKALSDPDHDDAHTRPSWLKKSRKESGVAGKGTTVSHLKSYGAGDSQSVMSASPDPDGLAGQSLNRDLALWDELYDISDESNLIQPHKSLLVTAPTEQYFVGRQAAWSPEGDWCVVVGNGNRAVICQRWPERKERMPARDRKNRKSATPAV